MANVTISVKVLKRANKHRKEIVASLKKWRGYALAKHAPVARFSKKTPLELWAEKSEGSLLDKVLVKEEFYPVEVREYFSEWAGTASGLINPDSIPKIEDAKYVAEGLVEISVEEYNKVTDLLHTRLPEPPKFTIDPYSVVKHKIEPWSGVVSVKGVYILQERKIMFTDYGVLYKGEEFKYNRRQIKAFKKLLKKESEK